MMDILTFGWLVLRDGLIAVFNLCPILWIGLALVLDIFLVSYAVFLLWEGYTYYHWSSYEEDFDYDDK